MTEHNPCGFSYSEQIPREILSLCVWLDDKMYKKKLKDSINPIGNAHLWFSKVNGTNKMAARKL